MITEGPKIDILTSIITDLERRESLKATDAVDTNFFITAMGVCSNHLQVYLFLIEQNFKYLVMNLVRKNN